MLAVRKNRNVNRIISFHYGTEFERLLVNLGTQTTMIERIPVEDLRAMRSWVQRLDKYIDAITPPVYTALAGVRDEDDGELTSARAKAAEARDESRRAEARREEEELDRLSAEGRADERDARDAQPQSTRYSRVDETEAAYGGDIVESGAQGDAPAARADVPDDGYTRAPRQGGYRRTLSDDYSAARRRPDAGDAEGMRLTYGSARSAQAQPAQPKPVDRQDYAAPKRPVPKPTEAVIDALDLHGALLNAQIADGSFLRYVLERQAFFGAWKRGWIHRGQRLYVADASVSQATMAEIGLARIGADALRTRDRIGADARADKIADADVIFDNTEGFIRDASKLNLRGKLLVCDTVTQRQAEQLTHMGLSKMAVLTPYVEDAFVTTAELEAMLSFIADREPRQMHLTDWVRLLETLQLRQDIFSLE